MDTIISDSPDARLCPTNVRESFERYVNDRIPTGGFLEAVLANDLKGAVGRADHINRRVLHHIVAYVYWEMPSQCHGSYEAVQKWLSERG